MRYLMSYGPTDTSKRVLTLLWVLSLAGCSASGCLTLPSIGMETTCYGEEKTQDEPEGFQDVIHQERTAGEGT